MKKSAKPKFHKTFRARRTRAKILGTTSRPRLSIFRSNAALFAQIIDDKTSKTLVSGSSKEVKSPATKNAAGTDLSGKVAVAFTLGQMLAEKAKKAGISAVVFDRGSYAYHGRVRALAEGAREGGLQF